MKILNLYYLVKPAIPHSLRLTLRNAIASRRRKRSSDVWPIDEAAGRTPDGWPGWPGNKRFAFVLTHDVEGAKGLDRCNLLANLEMELGFRSSFNFVPEGQYRLPSSLRTFLLENGFEVGVHDLHHDGSLYKSRAAFVEAAGRINDYLAQWQSVGFRSAFMFHNLDWLKDLNLLYDASTFDTDPFEPQPDGAGTVFPFWVEAANGRGYVELPYSLAQDSTMFLVLREKTNDIWKRKLDWVVEHGGMALINVHPDYISFEGTRTRTEFPVSMYSDFLNYVSSNYGNEAWFALPRQVAQYVKAMTHPAMASSEGQNLPAESVL